MSKTVFCKKYKEDLPALEIPPMPGQGVVGASYQGVLAPPGLPAQSVLGSINGQSNSVRGEDGLSSLNGEQPAAPAVTGSGNDANNNVVDALTEVVAPRDPYRTMKLPKCPTASGQLRDYFFDISINAKSACDKSDSDDSGS